MNAAKLKEPACWAGHGQEAIYRKNDISQKLHTVNSAILKTREKLHLDCEQWRRFSVFCARLALDDAPPEVRVQFTGKPSATSKDALLLAEIFTTLVIHAEDTATAANTYYDFTDIWAKAIEIWGGDL